jgi:hypothetical protein
MTIMDMSMTSTEKLVLLMEHKHVLEDLTGSYILSIMASLIIYNYFCKDH